MMEQKEKRVYEAPMFEEEEGMNFYEEIWEEFTKTPWCFGCTNCNCGCY